MKNRLLLEELKRFKRIINYDPTNPMINENVVEETQIIDSIINKIKPYLPISKKENKYMGSSFLQTILVDSGYCVYAGNCSKIDGDFGTTTEKSLIDFIGSTALTENELTTLEENMKDPNKKGDQLSGEKTYSNTESKFENKVEEKKENLKKHNIDLEKYNPKIVDYFLNYWKDDKKLKVGGEDLDTDIINYIVLKEGGISDDPDDTGPAKVPMPFPYNTQTKVLDFNGTEYTLEDERLPKPTKSTINPDSYESDKWHTNRGIVYGYWLKNIKGDDSLENVKYWLTLDTPAVYDYYKKYFYKKVSKNEVINHFFGLVKWGSGSGGQDSLIERIEEVFKDYDGDIDNAIEILGLPAVFDVLIQLRLEQYKGYNKDKYTRGWLNSLMNYYYYFEQKYIRPLADEIPDDTTVELLKIDKDELEDITDELT